MGNKSTLINFFYESFGKNETSLQWKKVMDFEFQYFFK
jgi:hypothetical protein